MNPLEVGGGDTCYKDETLWSIKINNARIFLISKDFVNRFYNVFGVGRVDVVMAGKYPIHGHLWPPRLNFLFDMLIAVVIIQENEGGLFRQPLDCIEGSSAYNEGVNVEFPHRSTKSLEHFLEERF